ncbi:GerA spore germination protein [Desulforamulus reducens MI-1]|uniref:GerA spore germination protein n=1 Tax=Desulforamulus reducens (strain ATCC BAA-1160 / DSM 100696 / MI-1) TaxID=349161 RepID=A4J5A4_DESRM|nr:spore germination protein [Desulforamulus reducens]ABO50257.1 GerA spore germination protein [Desulforamulus reducens MI-1]
MNWWKIIKKTFEYKPNTDREGFVLKETSQEKEQLAREQNPCHGKEGKGNDEAQKKDEKIGSQKRAQIRKPDKIFWKQEGVQKQGTREGLKDSEVDKDKRIIKKKEEKKEDRQNIKKPLKVHEAQDNHDPDRVSPYLEVNKKRIEEIYGLPDNKDFIIREFTIALAPPVQAFALFLEGMSEKAIINQNILQPMMLFSNFHEEVEGYLLDHVKKRVLTGNQVTAHERYEQIIGGVNFGSTAVFIDGCDQALVVETKGWEHRGVGIALNESVVRGSQEGFGEILRTNTALIRKYIRSSKLTTEMLKVGNVAQNDVALMYIRDIANESLVQEVKRRIKSLKIDGVIDSGILEQLIEERPWSIAPQVMATERPDRVALMLLRGKVAIFLDGNPYVLLVPTTLFDQLHTQEDYYLRPLFGSFLRLVRGLAFYISFLTPGVYLAIVLFHKEMIPTELLLAISGSREKVPFPSFLEVLLMEISFEMLREAGLRVPGILGNTIGIVGAIVLGQAAVQANIVSPILVIVVAVTGLASFAIPSYSLQFSLRIMRFVYIALAAMMGFVGIVFGLFVQMHMMASLKSFGVPYLAPMSPTTGTTGDAVFRRPVFSWEIHPDFLNTKKQGSQPKIARGWVKESTKREK